MTKKFYIAPELEILDAEMDEILMASPTAISADGLGEDNLMRDDETPTKDSWENAW